MAAPVATLAKHVAFDFEWGERSVRHCFEAQADANRDRLAIESSHGALTYDALDQAANRVAHRVLDSGRPQGPIALLLDQGAPLVVGMMGSFKAGTCFVPLDPSYALERNAFMLRDSEASIIVTGNEHLELARRLGSDETPVFNIDEDAATEAPGRPEVEVSPGTPAYLLYTSGSTGQPKGVVQTNVSLLHNVARHRTSLSIRPGDRQSLLYPCSVYGGMRDILNALLNGASLHHYPVRERGVAGLADWLEEEQITIYCSVATVFRHFARSLEPSRGFTDLREIKLGGEAPFVSDIELYKQRIPDHTNLHCGLASTETGMTRHFLVDKGTVIEGSSVPLGFPVQDMEVLVVDENREPVEPGTIGEIAIKSAYIALGYHGRADLNEQVFSTIDDPSSGRVFYTGDLGVLDEHGCLEHRGRKDFQIKIRGNRVEPREIEIALQEHGAIRDAVVVAKPDADNGNRLIAYIVSSYDPPPAARILRTHLLEIIPEHMLPSQYVGMDALPLTPNGKIDRNALPEPPSVTKEDSHERAGARDETEAALLRIWGAALRNPRIGVHDDFFELGGQSLIAAEVMGAIQEQFDKVLPLATLFRRPTVAELASALNSGQDIVLRSNLIPVKSSGRRRPFFFVPGIGGGTLFLQPLVCHLDPEQPIYGLEAPPWDGTAEPDDRVESIAATYIEAIKSVDREGPYLLGGYSFGSVVAFEMAQQLRADGKAVGLLAVLDHAARDPEGKSRMHPLYSAARLAWNLPAWIWDDLMRTPPIRMYTRVKGKLKGLYKVLRREEKTASADEPAVNIEAYFGVTTLPEPFLKVCQAHARASRRYVPHPYDGRVTVFRARAGPLLTPREPDLGWRWLARGGVDVCVVPGGHGNMVREPFAAVLARRLTQRIDAVSPPG